MSDLQMSPIGRMRRILLPTDGSEYSAGAERVAIAMTRKAGGDLEAFRVVPQGTDLDIVAPEADKKLTSEAIAQLEIVRKRAEEAGVSCKISLRQGADPYQAIVEASKDTQADLIVMGRRGRRGLARLMLGDATAKVMGYAPCAVMVVPEACDMWTRILVASDGSRSSDAAIVTAAKLAQCCDVPVVVLSVMVPSHSERRQAEAKPIVDRAVEYLKSEGIEAKGLVETGIADDVILEAADREGADLIILGSHGRTGIGRVLFGSKAERVINGSKCPVLVAKGL